MCCIKDSFVKTRNVIKVRNVIKCYISHFCYISCPNIASLSRAHTFCNHVEFQRLKGSWKFDLGWVVWATEGYSFSNDVCKFCDITSSILVKLCGTMSLL